MILMDREQLYIHQEANDFSSVRKSCCQVQGQTMFVTKMSHTEHLADGEPLRDAPFGEHIH